MSINNKDIKRLLDRDFDNIIDTISDALNNHMRENPYRVVCSSCGGDMRFTVEVDGQNDLRIEVDPCDCADL